MTEWGEGREEGEKALYFKNPVDGKMIKLYFNGLPAIEKKAIITPGGAYELSIGSFANGYAYGFIGAISNF